MPNTAHYRAFTIIEVLISIAIALLLILGINQVFSIAQQTSGAGTTALVQVEASRGAQAIMQRDFDNAVTGPDMPGIVIVSEPVYAFRNRQDMLGNQNTGPNGVQYINDPTNPNSTVGIRQSLTATNSRVHRVDRIMFFTRGTSTRQTGGSVPQAANFVSPTSWLESYVWYGHLALPDNYTFNQGYMGPRPGFSNSWTQSDFRNPGDPGPNNQPTTYNPNNFFASDWILGRVPIALVPFTSLDGSGNPEITMASGGTFGTPLTILFGSRATPARAFREATVPPQPPQLVAVNSPPWPLYSSRYDMAFTSIDQMRQALSNYPANNGSSPAWWQHLSGVQIPPNPSQETRFQGDPAPLKPQTVNMASQQASQLMAQWAPTAAARQAPLFLRGCSQFIVEFAGDFMTQNNDPSNAATFGRPIQAVPDGQIDYVVARLPTGELVKKVRWYGFPRDTTGDGHVLHDQNVAQHPQGDDVVPFRDMFNGAGLGFERWATQTLPPATDYALTPTTVPVGSQYICAWGWDTPNIPRPKMIRITIALDDPQGRLNGEQYFEYVFNLP